MIDSRIFFRQPANNDTYTKLFQRMLKYENVKHAKNDFQKYFGKYFLNYLGKVATKDEIKNFLLSKSNCYIIKLFLDKILVIEIKKQ